MIIGGVDPGRTGVGLVIDTVANKLWFHKFKFDDDNNMELGGWFNFIHRTNPSIIFIERVAGHGGSKSGGIKWSPATLFKLGDAFGQIRAAVAMTGKPFRLVSPRKWQKKMHDGIDGPTAKAKSMALYDQMFPNGPIPSRNGCKPNNNVVDALIIAAYGHGELNDGKIGTLEYEVLK